MEQECICPVQMGWSMDPCTKKDCYTLPLIYENCLTTIWSNNFISLALIRLMVSLITQYIKLSKKLSRKKDAMAFASALYPVLSGCHHHVASFWFVLGFVAWGVTVRLIAKKVCDFSAAACWKTSL